MSRAATGDATTIASIIGVRMRPACVADDSLTTWTNSGRNDSVPNITMPIAMPIAFDASTAGILKRSKGISGSVRPPLDEEERDEQDHARAERADDHRRAPPVVAAAALEREHEQSRPPEQRDHSEPVDAVLVSVLQRLDHHERHHQRS